MKFKWTNAQLINSHKKFSHENFFSPSVLASSCRPGSLHQGRQGSRCSLIELWVLLRTEWLTHFNTPNHHKKRIISINFLTSKLRMSLYQGCHHHTASLYKFKFGVRNLQEKCQLHALNMWKHSAYAYSFTHSCKLGPINQEYVNMW